MAFGPSNAIWERFRAGFDTLSMMGTKHLRISRVFRGADGSDSVPVPVATHVSLHDRSIGRTSDVPQNDRAKLRAGSTERSHLETPFSDGQFPT